MNKELIEAAKEAADWIDACIRCKEGEQPLSAFEVERQLRAAIAAAEKEPERGEVVVTKRDGMICCVTRQDEEGRILSVIAESEQPAQEPLTHSATECAAAFEWLRQLATQENAPPEAGIALDEWHAQHKQKANWKLAFEQEREKFQRETLRTSELHQMLKRVSDVLCETHSPGPWSRGCLLCALAKEAQELLDKPINAAAPLRNLSDDDLRAIATRFDMDPEARLPVFRAVLAAEREVK